MYNYFDDDYLDYGINGSRIYDDNDDYDTGARGGGYFGYDDNDDDDDYNRNLWGD